MVYSDVMKLIKIHDQSKPLSATMKSRTDLEYLNVIVLFIFGSLLSVFYAYQIHVFTLIILSQDMPRRDLVRIVLVGDGTFSLSLFDQS